MSHERHHNDCKIHVETRKEVLVFNSRRHWIPAESESWGFRLSDLEKKIVYFTNPWEE